MKILFLALISFVYSGLVSSLLSKFLPFSLDEFSALISFFYYFPFVFLVFFGALIFLRKKFGKRELVMLSVIPIIVIVYTAYNYFFVRPGAIQNMQNIERQHLLQTTPE